MCVTYYIGMVISATGTNIDHKEWNRLCLCTEGVFILLWGINIC